MPILTVREREILKLTTAGKSAKEIAQHLDISPRTVEDHRKKIIRKIGGANIVAACCRALKYGIIPAVLFLISFFIPSVESIEKQDEYVVEKVSPVAASCRNLTTNEEDIQNGKDTSPGCKDDKEITLSGRRGEATESQK